MHEPGIYHLDEQYAAALLRPILARLNELEGRLQHYGAHLRMLPEDRAAIEAAGRALEEARRELERIWRERIESGAWRRARE